MRILHRVKIVLPLIAIVMATAFTSGCGYIKLVLAKDQLNQGVIKFNQGNNREAKTFFLNAIDYDGKSAIAHLYYGATLVREYQEVMDTEKKKEMAGAALKVYEKALELSENSCRNKDNAMLYIAAIYEDIGNRAENRNWLLKRAEDSCSTPQVKASMYHTVAVQYWRCSFDQTQRFRDRAIKDAFHYRNMDYPAALPIKKEAEDCTAEGLRYIEKALEQNPDFVDSRFYKALLYRELQVLTKDPTKRREYSQTAERLTEEASDLRKKQELEAKQTPAAPHS
jgi:tetratricopeptide (TPR) repeat protein